MESVVQGNCMFGFCFYYCTFIMPSMGFILFLLLLLFSSWCLSYMMNSLTELNNDDNISQTDIFCLVKNYVQLGNRDVYSLDILSTIHEGGIEDGRVFCTQIEAVSNLQDNNSLESCTKQIQFTTAMQ